MRTNIEKYDPMLEPVAWLISGPTPFFATCFLEPMGGYPRGPIVASPLRHPWSDVVDLLEDC